MPRARADPGAAGDAGAVGGGAAPARGGGERVQIEGEAAEEATKERMGRELAKARTKITLNQIDQSGHERALLEETEANLAGAVARVLAAGRLLDVCAGHGECWAKGSSAVRGNMHDARRSGEERTYCVRAVVCESEARFNADIHESPVARTGWS
eukprot:TRINITY_DN50281_c0_g1_i3.p1 TRINITY_DN50281_c0_g1~~TRINITY_DN50281_c0_g1_i3.p1  ORF type:complete len:155 (-),score=28.00 TRINITY_DN50281_c0_g1_i3:38-502(-)